MHCVSPMNTSNYSISFSIWVLGRYWAWGTCTPEVFMVRSLICSWAAHTCKRAKVSQSSSLSNWYSACPLSAAFWVMFSSEFLRWEWWLSIPCTFLRRYTSPLFLRQHKHDTMQNIKRRAATTPNEIVNLLKISSRLQTEKTF